MRAQATGELRERIERAADRTIQMALALPRYVAARVIGGQIVRSAGSVGANFEEAQAVLTRRNYVHKVSLSLREARETLYWMRRIEKNQMLPGPRLGDLRREWDEIVAILTFDAEEAETKEGEGRGMIISLLTSHFSLPPRRRP